MMKPGDLAMMRTGEKASSRLALYSEQPQMGPVVNGFVYPGETFMVLAVVHFERWVGAYLMSPCGQVGWVRECLLKKASST